jgi:four helix bundle protein
VEVGNGFLDDRFVRFFLMTVVSFVFCQPHDDMGPETAINFQRSVGHPRSSIPSNIAEGCGRSSEGEFAHFLNISMGSASELEYRVLLSRDLHYLNNADYEELEARITEVKRMLASLIRTLIADR